ncbi:MAG: hypothetical protein R2827_10995 [Bdellovibrionales bacterium]
MLNSQPMGFYSPHALLQAAQRDGVSILPICINLSEPDHVLQNIQTKAERPPLYGIRLGFRLINGLSTSIAQTLLQERQSAGPIKTWTTS